MPDIVQWVIAEEFRSHDSSDTDSRAAFRVCEKLRRPLSTLAGVAGFRSLLVRALALAKADAPWLAQVVVSLDGSISFTAELEAVLSKEESAKGGRALVAQLIGLLVGEGLTLRFLGDAWPKVAHRKLTSGDEV